MRPSAAPSAPAAARISRYLPEEMMTSWSRAGTAGIVPPRYALQERTTRATGSAAEIRLNCASGPPGRGAPSPHTVLVPTGLRTQRYLRVHGDVRTRAACLHCRGYGAPQYGSDV